MPIIVKKIAFSAGKIPAHGPNVKEEGTGLQIDGISGGGLQRQREGVLNDGSRKESPSPDQHAPEGPEKK